MKTNYFSKKNHDEIYSPRFIDLRIVMLRFRYTENDNIGQR
ncbi:hypothetical protein DI53_2973 [Sphingobacterium deserti]|uniref:Uncharacterized protein n=1 Tax=Sphingobacterium deserti TaxID=1229276 RepID=A0A0B8SZR1_9SPHI|nr:hypothetical protein DI53_2973 [Sphingobacterium deserti]